MQKAKCKRRSAKGKVQSAECGSCDGGQSTLVIQPKGSGFRPYWMAVISP